MKNRGTCTVEVGREGEMKAWKMEYAEGPWIERSVLSPFRSVTVDVRETGYAASASYQHVLDFLDNLNR
jgi:hypothetical protein